jgi:hypothetical protein
VGLGGGFFVRHHAATTDRHAYAGSPVCRYLRAEPPTPRHGLGGARLPDTKAVPARLGEWRGREIILLLNRREAESIELMGKHVPEFIERDEKHVAAG